MKLDTTGVNHWIKDNQREKKKSAYTTPHSLDNVMEESPKDTAGNAMREI